MNLNLAPLNILIVGLGKVGMKYDLNAPKSQVLTHTRAIESWAKRTKTTVNMVGVDFDPETEKPFSKIFDSSQWFPNIDLVDSNVNFDLAIIATPIASISHDTIQAYKSLNISKILVEKPAAKTKAELDKLTLISESCDNFIVGFPRPLLVSSNYLKNLIQSYGEDEIWNVDIYYGGGVLNILSHFLNLIEFLIEPFLLVSFSFTPDGYLNAEFKSNNGRLIINTHQYSKINDERNRIHIQGPIIISYNNSGRDIQINDSRDTTHFDLAAINTHEEISQMIGNFGEKYLRWASYGEKSAFTYLSSSSLIETIKLAEGENVE